MPYAGKSTNNNLGRCATTGKTYRLGDTVGNIRLEENTSRQLERKSRTVIKTIAGLEAMKLLYTLCDTVCKTETGNFWHTLNGTLAEGNI